MIDGIVGMIDKIIDPTRENVLTKEKYIDRNRKNSRTFPDEIEP